jgi:RNA polymerase sigma-70 factor, ECF subfamily
MATRSTMLFEDGGLGTAFNQALHCSELLSSIYTAHYQHVLQVCRRFFHRPEDAEDAAAEVFLKLHTVLPKKDNEHPFRPWVCQVAGRHCIDKLRRGKREKNAVVVGSDLGTLPDASSPSPLSQVLRNEADHELRQHLNRLPDYYKVPLMLHYYKCMSYSEIAHKLNRRLPAVKTIIFRAKNRLRRNLGHLESTRQAQASSAPSSESLPE